MSNYIGLIHKQAESDYGVSFPDFPGVVTAGETLDEARTMAEEALAFHVHGMIEDGDAIPEPSSLELIMAEPENRDGVAILVTPWHGRFRPCGGKADHRHRRGNRRCRD